MSTTLFTTAPPRVIRSDIIDVMDGHYGGVVAIKKLSGERDSNFKVRNLKGDKLILKFINGAETTAETRMQVAVLKHLQNKPLRVEVPEHISSLTTGADWVKVETNSGTVRVRAYSYLAGCPGGQLKTENQSWYDFGAVIADLIKALQSFNCSSADRPLLWDVSQLSSLKPLVSVVEDTKLLASITDFVAYFEDSVQPQLNNLPRQVIHSDISPSNTLCNAEQNRVSAVLDFGDMVMAPRVVELAVAASYQMSRYAKPLLVLEYMKKGFTKHIKLSALEEQLLFDLVLARLVQRIVITSWRAAKFPANKDYILRSKDDAEHLFKQLIDIPSAEKMGVM